MASYTIAVLNAIRDGASSEYQARVPVATRTNLSTIGQTFETYTTLMNEFTTNLIGKIGLTVFAHKMAKNKLAPFKKGALVNASDVEEIFVSMAKGVDYDKTGANPLGRRKPDNVNVLYHRENYKLVYEVSVSDAQVKMAFRSEEGIQELLTNLINAMYSGANYDEYVNMKELLATYKTGANYNYFDYEVPPITDQASAAKFVKAVRKAVQDMSFMSKTFNSKGVPTYTDPSDLVLLINKDVVTEVDVEVLSKAFNMGKTDIETRVVVLDDFGTMTNTYGLLVDKSFFMVFDTLRTVESIRNPQGLFTNYFLHIWQIQSLSRFKNAVRFLRTP